MAIEIDKLKYSPTLRLRALEMRAVEQLFDLEKSQFLPTFLLRPWTTATTIEKALDRIDLAMANGPYCLNFDPLYFGETGHADAVAQYENLKNHAAAWYDFVERRENCIPYLRSEGGFPNLNAPNMRWLQERGFGISLMYPFHELSSVAAFISQREDSNFFVNVDAGWDLEVLNKQLAVNGVVRALIQANENVNIVVTSSTFPNSFDGVGLDYRHSLAERTLFENAQLEARSISNRANIFYGDWATTRPPSNTPMPNFWPRIDVPLTSEIRMFREKGNDVRATYEELAEEIVQGPYWDQIPDCWGKYLIDITSSGGTGGIFLPTQNVPPRINMHLHTQISAAHGGPQDSGVEEYED
ncbi:hypothetical protein [Ponticaulis sp.]|uniref:beta family protein n=1 Tax=Ponticaulis sp. TaxID=2020902 RepID=UPI000B682647|nr:hypothetical protein [Ponticaulis sp.]MAI88879.1 hypothetical protein [Ponticaulis sp.]OUY01570.1 MAG: hypothetical protein CBB65_00170 [Hyphomonadaceae bacterium TMED5]|tara:strand:+ start:2339 stop:3406 length:1068 start_codon:yes stop_codon:yes gene_type:complete